MGTNPLYSFVEAPKSDAAATSNAPRQTYQERNAVKCDCPFFDCEKRFETEKEMRQHKHNEPDHFYCKKCDKLDDKKRADAAEKKTAYPPRQPGQFDFEDWDAITVHKVEAMAPFVEGRQKPTDDNPPPHITCEFCGEDFKSFGGRKRHRIHMHPADQDVECPGCKQHFVRAHNMIRHLEKNQCINKRSLEFYRNISHKYILSQFINNPHKLVANFAANKIPAGKYPGRIAERDEVLNDEEGGGVSLLDQADEAQMGGYKPLQPDSNLIDLHPHNLPASSSNVERWPHLPGRDSSDVASSMRNMSISSTAQSTTATSLASGATVRRKGSGQASKIQCRRDSVIKSDDMSTTTPSQKTSSAWTTKTTEKLFPYSKEPKKQPRAGDWNGILAQTEAETALDDNTNLWKSRWWDPTSAEYSVERFFNQMEEAYMCPFESCEDDGLKFEFPSDLHAHMAHAHIRQVYGCPSCQKRFYSPSSLVAHAESTRRCYVRDSAKFKKFISDITGGYLKAKEMVVPKIYHTDAVIKKGPQVQGVMETKFIGQNPQDN